MKFPVIKLSNQGNVFRNFLRNDRLFVAKKYSDSDLYKLFEGLAVEIGVCEGILDRIQIDYDIRQSENLIEDWEKALGIPDDVFNTSGSLDQRRKNVLVKLASLGVSTKQDFIDLAAIYNVVIDIVPGEDELTFPLPFPLSFNQYKARWVMIVKVLSSPGNNLFPLNFPFVFGDSGANIVLITALFQKLVPSMIKVIYKYV